MENRIIKHPNGYSARLYGESSMIIFSPEGKERMHTGFRSVNTEEEVLELLEHQAEFEKMLMDLINIKDDEDDE